MKIELDYPLQTPIGEVKTITLRRGKTSDMLAAQRIEPKDAAKREMVLMAMLTEEKLTAEDLEGLDLADSLELQAAFQSLLQRKLRPADVLASAGAASEVVRDAAVGDSRA